MDEIAYLIQYDDGDVEHMSYEELVNIIPVKQGKKGKDNSRRKGKGKGEDQCRPHCLRTAEKVSIRKQACGKFE